MGVAKFLGSFLQASFFGGTYDDLAFEIRVLKEELARVHERLDKEMAAVGNRLDQLEGKPAKGKGKGRLRIMSSAEVADVEPGAKAEAAPAGGPEPTLEAANPSPALSLGLAQATVGDEESGPSDGFLASMSIHEAWRRDPGAPQVFADHSLPGCIHCAVGATESIEAGAGDHGVDVVALVADLNRLVQA